MVAQSTVEHAPGSRVKTDRLDAGKLARDREQGRLKGVRFPTRAQHAQRQLSRTYAQALKDKQRAQARVRSLMQEQGRIGPLARAGWNAHLRWCTKQHQQLPATVSQCIEELFHLREAAQATVKRLRAALHKLSAESQHASLVKGLKAQAGVGTFTAVRLVLELGDIRRFPTAGSFPRYLGLTPSEYSTSASERRGHVMKVRTAVHPGMVDSVCMVEHPAGTRSAAASGVRTVEPEAREEASASVDTSKPG